MPGSFRPWYAQPLPVQQNIIVGPPAAQAPTTFIPAAYPPQAGGAYIFYVHDLRTNTQLGELPLESVDFDTALNVPGGFRGRMPLADARIAVFDPIALTEPGKIALYVDRGGVLVWGGIIWTRRYDSTTGMLDIGAKEFTAYFGKRQIRETRTYTAQDQLTIARDLVNYAQGKLGGNIGVTVGAETSGVLRDRIYNGFETKPILEAISELAQLENGFDFTIRVVYAAGVPTKILEFGYPRRGRIWSETGHVFEHPGSVLGISWPEDGDLMANNSLAIGAGEGEAMLDSVASDTSKIDAGYPLLERSSAYKDIAVQTTLDAHARADLAAYSRPIVTGELRARTDLDPVLGSYIAGDDAKVRFLNERWNSGRKADGTFKAPGLESYVRILGYKVRPGEDEGSTEEVTLTVQLV